MSFGNPSLTGSGEDLAVWTADADINTDMNLKLQYLAGRGLNLYQNDSIYRNMVQGARYPEGLFTGSEATLNQLRTRIQNTLAISQR